MNGNWKKLAPPVSEEVLQSAINRIGVVLPPAFLDLYRQCDGGEGSLPFQPWRLVLWGIREVADLREHEHYKMYYPQFVFFGSNGAGEYFGIDRDQRVFFMDAVAGGDSIRVVAQSFSDFVAQFGRHAPTGEEI